MTKLPAVACLQAAQHSFAAAPARARLSSRWSFSCAAPRSTTSPGVFISFEETEEELTKNVASLGFDLNQLTEEKKILIDYVFIERSEIEETGDYDLEGLFLRLSHAIDSIGAKRVVIDTLEALFSALPNEAIIRAELRRLFRWLKTKGVTAVITCERGEGTLTRYGLEEYVADCVVLLDHRVQNQISTRRMRIVKYRGTAHGTNEYPFLIDEKGFSVLPITSIGLGHSAPDRAHLVWRAQAGYDVERSGLLSRKLDPCFRNCRHRKEHYRSSFR